MVNCRSQAQFAAKLMPHLTEKETAVYKRGRNAAPKSTAKNGTVAEYHSATGLECLFGYLHLNGEQARVEELFGLIVGLVFGGFGRRHNNNQSFALRIGALQIIRKKEMQELASIERHRFNLRG